ncbi:MAG: glycosyltransferase [Nanoarchaeota archaeon]|nr:glycosyltransferase [Nanoarchaeota archaeon]
MKVLITSRTYVDAKSGLHEQLDILSNYEDLDLHLFAPKKYKRMLKTYYAKPEQFSHKKYKVKLSNLFFLRKESALFSYFPFFTYLYKLKPDVIHIEEEPYSLFCFQIVFFCKIFLPKTKLILFSWENIFRNRIFPLSFFEKFCLKHGDYALPGNEDAMIILRKKGFKKPQKIVPRYGIDLNKFKKIIDKELKSKLNLNGKIIGFIGRLVEDKAIDTLFDAVKRLKEPYTLVLVGDGPLRNEIVKLAKKLGIDENIRYIKTVNYVDIPKYISLFDVFVLPSRSMPKWKEQFGHVLIEAMACEVPIIGSDSGEIPNVIADAGLVFHENDSDELYNQIKKVLENNDFKKNLIEKGLKRVKDFTYHKIVEQYYETYKKLYNENKSP